MFNCCLRNRKVFRGKLDLLPPNYDFLSNLKNEKYSGIFTEFVCFLAQNSPPLLSLLCLPYHPEK